MPENEVEMVYGLSTSLGDYLDRGYGGTRMEIVDYEFQLENTRTMKAETRAILDSKRAELAKFDNARKALKEGNKAPGFAIIEEQIETYKDRIKFNRENSDEKNARENNNALVVLQMILAHEKGVEPPYYGSKLTGDEEPFRLPESVGRSDIVNSALFKTVMAFGSYHNPSSGYYPEPVSVDPETVISKLFDYDCGLNGREIRQMINQVNSIFGQIKKYAEGNFKWRYERSLPRFPSRDMKPNELMQFGKYNALSETPNALFYTEGGEVKCRFSKEKDKGNQVFDISQPTDGIECVVVGTLEQLSDNLQTKILHLLNSEELRKRWEKLVPRTKMPEVVFA